MDEADEPDAKADVDRHFSGRNHSAVLARLCLVGTLIAAGCSPAWAQTRYDFRFFGSGFAIGLQTLVPPVGADDLRLREARDYERGGSIERAAERYVDVLSASGFSPSVALEYASFLERRGRIDTAEQVLTALSRDHPQNLNVLSALAQIELTRRDWVKAQSVAEQIRGANDTSGMADRVLGEALIGQGKFDEGIAVFQRAADASPSAIQPKLALVTALARAQKTDRAVDILKSVLQANPDNAEAHVLMGSIQLAAGAADQALQYFKLAVDKQPKNVAGYQALVGLYVRQRKFDEAMDVIRSGLRVEPDSTTMHLALAGVFEQTGRYEDAIGEYERMLDKQPDSLIAANNLASLLSDRRGDKASLARARRLVAILRESPVPQFMDTLGWVSLRSGDTATAVELLDKAAAALPNNAVVRYHLGMSYGANGQAGKAAEQLKAALALTPDKELDGKIRDALKIVAK